MDGSGDPAQLVRAYEREWRIDLNELHYKFELRERVFIPREEVKMQTMDYNEEVLN